MKESLGFAVLAFTSLLSIVNPLGAVPIYVAMTSSYDARQRRVTLRRAVMTGLAVLVAFAAFGPLILRFFGITTEAFQIAGGIIPLGLPTLVGPGAITTVIAINAQAKNAFDVASVYLSIVLVLAISGGLLAAAPVVTRRIGSTGMNVMTRLMGLMVMVVGAQFEINGVSAVARQITGGG